MGAWITTEGSVTHFKEVDLDVVDLRFVVRFAEDADQEAVTATIQYLRDWLERNPLKAKQIANGVAEGI